MEMVKCECCDGPVSGAAVECVHCGHPTPKRRADHGHLRLAWGVVFFLSILSLFGVFFSTFLADHMSAPQQCAAIAACIGFTVIPYCYARAVEKF
jgi:hypothetical protein